MPSASYMAVKAAIADKAAGSLCGTFWKNGVVISDAVRSRVVRIGQEMPRFVAGCTLYSMQRVQLMASRLQACGGN